MIRPAEGFFPSSKVRQIDPLTHKTSPQDVRIPSVTLLRPKMASHHHPQQAGGGGDYNLDLANFDISDYMQTSGPPTMDQPTMFSGNSRPSNDSMNGATNAIQSSNPSQAAVGTGRPPSLSVAAAGNSVLDHHSNHPYGLPSSSDHHQIMFGGVDQQPPSQGMPPQARPGQSGVNNGFTRGLVTTETLKLQLQQQLRLQQLQQLQNQILQQQVSLQDSLVFNLQDRLGLYDVRLISLRWLHLRYLLCSYAPRRQPQIELCLTFSISPSD